MKYRPFVRSLWLLIAWCAVFTVATSAWAQAVETLSICSFNIQFLGSSAVKDNAGLAKALKDFDIVVIEELIAPPYAGTFPDGTPFKPQPKSAKFFDQMKLQGFTYKLSEEDTGPGISIHSNGTSTEWWVAFYKSDKVSLASDLPSGFLAADRAGNVSFQRVPYAFGFRTANKKLDFVLIPVHLQPNPGSAEGARRKHELGAIASWIHKHDHKEKDFVILGDTNIQSATELTDATPKGLRSLNATCVPTNTNPKSPKPYDHVFFNPSFTKEIDASLPLNVIDLSSVVKPLWPGPGTFPGNPYNHDRFRAAYSDHDPVWFRMTIPTIDDD